MEKSKLTSEELQKLYLKGKTLAELSTLAGIGEVAIWKRLQDLGTPMRPATPRGPWAKEGGGEEFLGSDGRYWVREIPSTKHRGSKRRAVVVMEEFLGHPIPRGYVVHHKNGIPTDDRIENLELLTVEEHNHFSRRPWTRNLHYRDFSEAYLMVNRSILTYPKMLDYLENTRGVIEDLFLTLDSIDCEKVDLAPLGYSHRKWGHLVKTYIDLDKLKEFFHLCEISKGISIGYDFKRKDTGNGSCMREVILTRHNRKKPWTKATVIWRATELQKRWAADLILLHHLFSKVPNSQFTEIEFFITSAYQSGMYVIPLVEPVFGVKMKNLDPTAHPYWGVIRYRNDKYYQEDSPRQKLSPAQRMQDVANAIREGKTFEPITYKDFELEV